jgi:hypothetical protein
MQACVVEKVETLKQEIYQLEKQSNDFNTYDDLKNMLFRVNAVQRAIFEELNRRTIHLIGKTA